MSTIKFSDCYQHLCRTLAAEGEDKRTANEFSAISSNFGRVEFTRNLLEKYDLFPKAQSKCKSNEVSEKFRREGNELFKFKKNWDALEMYTKSVALAENGSECLAIAYANRSAVLYDSKLYRECLIDIKMALNSNYPPNIREKLERRRSNANTLISSQPPTKRHGDVPRISAPNSSVSCAADSIKIAFSDEMGRHVIAARDIQIGEVLAVEEPYVKILLKEKYRHCHSCLDSCYNLIPCDKCSSVLFCGETCRAEAWDSFHKHECPLLDTLEALDMDQFGYLALRIAIVASIKECRKDQDDIYQSGRYKEIHELIANTDKRSVPDLFKRSFKAAIIYDLVTKNTNFFYERSEEYKEYFKELLLRHLQTGPSNFHDISELIGSGNVFYSPEKIGAGAYSFLSLLNHSCNPNVTRHYFGTHIALRALRPIKQGNQIFDNYGYHYALMTKQERQEQLKAQYYFDCVCEACTEDWPLYKDMKQVNDDFDVTDEEFEELGYGKVKNLPNLVQKVIGIAESLDDHGPCQDLGKAQEVLKQCFMLMGNKVTII